MKVDTENRFFEEIFPSHNYKECKVIDCEYCQGLIDYGIIEACDNCDSVGSSESDGWVLLKDGQLLCVGCFEKEKIDEKDIIE